MTSRPRQWLLAPVLATLGLVYGGTAAHADFTLDVAVAGGPSLSFNSTTGAFTLTGGIASHTYTFKFNGTNSTFTTDGSGNGGGTATTTDNYTPTFSANGLGGVSTFGTYAISSIAVTAMDGVSRSQLLDTSVDTKNSGSAQANDLTISVSREFSIPSSPQVVLESKWASSQTDSGTVSFVSSIGATSTSILSGSFLAPPNPTLSQVTVTPGTNPYTVSNQIVISNLNAGGTDNLSMTTNVYATPEPGTLTLAFAGLPLAAGLWLRKRRRGLSS